MNGGLTACGGCGSGLMTLVLLLAKVAKLIASASSTTGYYFCLIGFAKDSFLVHIRFFKAKQLSNHSWLKTFLAELPDIWATPRRGRMKSSYLSEKKYGFTVQTGILPSRKSRLKYPYRVKSDHIVSGQA